ncbi:MAG: hypothetical protein COX61_01765 [Candidatus Brennerbacteria bacterium CG_4_10_14_0_2_um_filter_43_14]|nr:MAG: hypothetical protein COX61_01765 [Candidatus Brennerbacteria bacterium CG_4_10_14_0_2_um_filter_43_14]
MRTTTNAQTTVHILHMAIMNEDEAKEIDTDSDRGENEDEIEEDGETKKSKKTSSPDTEDGDEETQDDWALPDLDNGGVPLDPFGNEKPEEDENEDLINEL